MEGGEAAPSTEADTASLDNTAAATQAQPRGDNGTAGVNGPVSLAPAASDGNSAGGTSRNGDGDGSASGNDAGGGGASRGSAEGNGGDGEGGGASEGVKWGAVFPKPTRTKLKRLATRMIEAGRAFEGLHHSTNTDSRLAGATESEHLDHDTWKMTRYKYRWPDVDMAKQYGRDRKICDGGADLLISQKDMNRQLPFGMVLYFRFLTLLIILFGCLSLIIVPLLVFTYSSNYLHAEMATASSFQRAFAYSTIGNLGTDRLSAHERDQCARLAELVEVDAADAAVLGRCGVANVTVLGHDVDLVTVSHVFTVFDAAAVVFFFVFTVLVGTDTRKLKRAVDIDQTTVRDFAVEVDGLPVEAQKLDVQNHFEDLYRLDRKFEWRGNFNRARRHEVPMTQEEMKAYSPITDDEFARFDEVDHRDRSGHTLIRGGWVAEVSLAKSRGDVIRAFLKHQKVLLRISRLRAKIKRHRGDAPPQPGGRADETGSMVQDFPRDEKIIAKCEAQLQKLEGHLRGLASLVSYDLNKDMDDTVLAYVVFNHVESRRRCVRDYARSRSMFARFLVPRELYFSIPLERLYAEARFLDDSGTPGTNPNYGRPKKHLLDNLGRPRQYLLRVRQAPEPGTIIWENIEVEGIRKCLVSTGGCLVALAVVLVGLLLVVFGKGMQTAFRETSLNPDYALCPGGSSGANESESASSPELSSFFHGSVDTPPSHWAVRRGDVTGFPDLAALSLAWVPSDAGADSAAATAGTLLDDMCAPATDTQVAAGDDAFQFYFDFGEWERPPGLHPVWVCAGAEIVCEPTVDAATGYPSFEAPGMDDADFNGVVDDGLCRWRAADVVKSCAFSGSPSNDTVDLAGPVQRACLEVAPGPGDFGAGLSCAFDAAAASRGNGAVLRWSTLPYYPVQQAQPPASLAEAMFPNSDPVVSRVACSEYKAVRPRAGCAGQQPSQTGYAPGGPLWRAPWWTDSCGPDATSAPAYNGDEPPDTRKIEECALYSDYLRGQVTTWGGTVLRTTLVDALSDFGPVTHRVAPRSGSAVGGPVRNETYIASVFTGNSSRGPLPGHESIVATGPGAFAAPPTAEQKAYALESWRQFTVGACAHPCVNVKQTRLMCGTLSCSDSAVTDVTLGCTEHTANTAAGCYCVDALLGNVFAAGFAEATALIVDSPVCAGLLQNYAFATASYYVMVGAVVVINFVVGEVLKKVAMMQAPASWSQYFVKSSLAIFWARFVVNGLLVMLVNSDGLANAERFAPGVFAFLRYVGVLDGAFSDFGSSWYATVGGIIIFMMFLNIFQQHIGPILKSALQPVMICLRRRSVLIQYDLDRLYVGPNFEPEQRYPEVMNTVFITMLYAGGAPILYLFACVSMFITYWLDKILILRVYNRGNMDLLDGSLAQLFLELLPWALVVHLPFTIYMYGSNDAMYDTRWGEGLLVDLAHSGGDGNTTAGSLSSALFASYFDWLNATAQYDALDLIPRLTRSNTVLLVVLLLVVIAGNLLKTVLGSLIRCLSTILCPTHQYAPIHELQKEAARGFDDYTRDVENPFTDDWTIWVLKHHMDDFFEHTAALGVPRNQWEIVGSRDEAVAPGHPNLMDDRTDNDFVTWNIVRKLWAPGMENLGRLNHQAYEPKTTWEVCAETNTFSYLIQLNAKYAVAMGGVEEEVEDILEDSADAAVANASSPTFALERRLKHIAALVVEGKQVGSPQPKQEPGEAAGTIAAPNNAVDAAKLLVEAGEWIGTDAGVVQDKSPHSAVRLRSNQTLVAPELDPRMRLDELKRMHVLARFKHRHSSDDHGQGLGGCQGDGDVNLHVEHWHNTMMAAANAAQPAPKSWKVFPASSSALPTEANATRSRVGGGGGGDGGGGDGKERKENGASLDDAGGSTAAARERDGAAGVQAATTAELAAEVVEAAAAQ